VKGPVGKSIGRPDGLHRNIRRMFMTDTTTKTPKARSATFTPEALQAVIAQAVAEATAKQQAHFEALMAAKTPTANGKSDVSAKNDWACIKAFKKLGITAKPRVDTFTFNIWVSKGFRPVEGSKAVKVANLRLFHQSQVRKLTSAEVQAVKAKDQGEAATKRTAKIVPISEGASPQA